AILEDYGPYESPCFSFSSSPSLFFLSPLFFPPFLSLLFPSSSSFPPPPPFFLSSFSFPPPSSSLFSSSFPSFLSPSPFSFPS
ncbi:hypothetical protein ACXWR7_12035, partial [Streptococcus pyogenes]